MGSLDLLLDLLKRNYRKTIVPIPSAWYFPVNDASGRHIKDDLYGHLINLIQKHILPAKESFDPDPVIYGSLLRTTTAMDFDGDGRLLPENRWGLKESGTLLRMILLLPFLKKMGVNMLYLLPVTKPSRYIMKGVAPSPYAVNDFFRLDEDLYDPMTGGYSQQKMDLQFSALVEACHKLGMRLILDFIPRTAGRDCSLILDHPDWFYWIRKSEEKNFKPPRVPGLKPVAFHEKFAKRIYASPEVKAHLSKFSYAPNHLDPEKWLQVKAKCKGMKSGSILPLIEDAFAITTVPGFSDVINDPQPIWKDVTFLRLHLDHPLAAKPYLPEKQPPYVLYDVIKASRSRFKMPNKDLWDMISGIIPFYRKRFGVDGARIDMGHALPRELEKMMIKNARAADKNSFLIAEELDNAASLKAKKAGYDSIIGTLWADEPRWEKGNIHNVFYKALPALSIPILASSEIPDSPRAMQRNGQERFLRFSAILNYFLPNSIPFINSGFELKEIQPLNLGLDSLKSRVDLLKKNDLNYGKLAFFDYTSLHWNVPNESLLQQMQEAVSLRKVLVQKDFFKSCQYLDLGKKNHSVLACYSLKGKSCLLLLINTDLYSSKVVRFKIPSKNPGRVSWSVFYNASLDDPSKFSLPIFQKRSYKIKMAAGQILVLNGV